MVLDTEIMEKVVINNPEKIVPQDRMDVDLPGYAWDLLPFKSKPFDLYRSSDVARGVS